MNTRFTFHAACEGCASPASRGKNSCKRVLSVSNLIEQKLIAKSSFSVLHIRAPVFGNLADCFARLCGAGRKKRGQKPHLLMERDAYIQLRIQNVIEAVGPESGFKIIGSRVRKQADRAATE